MTIQLIRGPKNLIPQLQSCVVTIGNFDGLHKGHQALLAKTKERAKALGLPTAVVTFEPLPSEYFAKDGQPKTRLMRLREKIHALKQAQIDKLVVLSFNKRFAEQSAADFIQQVLHHGLKAKHVVVGDDFRFGRGREGDFQYLQREGEKLGFTVESMASVTLNNERISSTRLRQALKEANHSLVEQMLDQPYYMKGRVIRGDQRGRSIGFPTANIHIKRKVTPIQGVYIVRLHGIDDRSYPGVANIGVRPTVDGTRILLEVHLFNFDQDIYGREVRVEFCEKLRDEKRYESFELLKQQIQKDAENARTYFVKRGELE